MASVRESRFRDFLAFPAWLYRGHPCWVPPLRRSERIFFDPSSNPFWRHAQAVYFVARRGNKLVGRMGVCCDRHHDDFHQERTALWGFWESVNDEEVARGLFDAAERWGRRHGAQRLRGPFNFTTNHTCGLLVEGFESEPCLMMTYNYPYYESLALQAGLVPCQDLLAFVGDPSRPVPEKVERIAARLEQEGRFRVRPLCRKRFEDELKLLLDVYNDAWHDNWGFVPMTEEEFFAQGEELKAIVDPGLALIAEEEGKPVGFSLTLPNLNPLIKKIGGRLFPWGWAYLLWAGRKVASGRLITMGIRRAYHRRGIDGLFYLRTRQEALARGWRELELSWILGTNQVMINTLTRWGTRLSKRYRIYEKIITPHEI